MWALFTDQKKRTQNQKLSLPFAVCRYRHAKRLESQAPVSMRIAITISAAVLDLCLRKTRADKSPDYRDVIAFEMLRFQNVFSEQ